MDLQSRIKEQKKKLKGCKTVITDFDGKKFEVQENKIKEIGQGLSFVVDERPDMQIARVLSGLFLSSQDPVSNIKTLNEHGICHILSLGVEPNIKFTGIQYHFIPMIDLPECNISQIIKNCFHIIHLYRRNNILVHCNAGVSRSATIVISYLMIAEKLPYQLAFERVKAVRNCIKPNDGFVQQLKMLQVHNDYT